MRSILLALAFITSFDLLSSQVNAAILTTGDFENGMAEPGPGGTLLPTLTITTDVNFHIQESGEVRFFAFDNWLPSDPMGISTTLPAPFGIGPSAMTYQINGGTIQLANIDGFFDSWGNSGEMTVMDGGFAFVSTISVSAGDVLTIRSQSFTLGTLTHPSGSIVPSPIPALFEGPAYVSNNVGAILGRVANVPEPSSAAFGFLAVLVLLRRRSR